MNEGLSLNTDKELYREPAESEGMAYYSDSVHVTKNGLIGMNHGGLVFELPIKKWHQYAKSYLSKRNSDHTTELAPPNAVQHYCEHGIKHNGESYCDKCLEKAMKS